MSDNPYTVHPTPYTPPLALSVISYFLCSQGDRWCVFPMLTSCLRIIITLKGANLEDADLEDANLYVANLQDANIQGINLTDANVKAAILPDRELDD